jgi:hypothetical protein
MRDVSGHTVTIGHIVGRLLQLWEPDNPQHPAADPDQVISLLGFDLEDVENKIRLAEDKGSSAEERDQRQDNAAAIQEHLSQGELIERELLCEVEIYRQNPDKTVLTIIVQPVEGDVYGSEDISFVTKTVYDWAENRFSIEIPEWAPAARSVPEMDLALKNARKYSDLEREKHLIMIAGLVEFIAHKQGGQYGKLEDPNRSLIATKVHELLKAEGLDRSGFSAETMRDRFSEAIKTRKEFSSP